MGWLWVLMGAAVLNQVTIHLVRPTTTYKLLAFESGSLTVGLVTASYALLPLVLAMSLGALAQRVRNLKPLLVAGSALVASGAVVVSAAGNVLLVALGTTVLGLGHLVFTIAGQSAVVRFAESHQLDKGFGWFEAGFATGQMIGPLLGGLLLNTGTSGGGVPIDTVNQALWIGTIVSVPAIFLLGFTARLSAPNGHEAGKTSDTEGTDSAGEPAHPPTILRILRRPGIPSHLLASFAVVAILDILTAFLPLVGESVGVSPAWVGALLAIRAAATIASRFLLPSLRRWCSREALVLASLWGSAVTLVLPPLVMDHLALSAVTMALAGFFLGLGQPLTMSLVTQAVPDVWRSSALALRLVANRIGQVAVPLAAGAVAAPLGPAGAIWFSCAFLSLSGTEKLIRRKRTKEA